MKILIKNLNQTLEFNEDKHKTLLEFLKENNVKIKSNCDGNGACGKCHISFDKETYKKFKDIDDAELDLLDKSMNNTATSRLSCRVFMTNDLDNAEITIINE